ncbi:MAG: PDZ domain-containing protein [Deltaproteobacteria bacterium]|nr:PDZ domain-containing protein [Deltaproteobacteria bacterium]
MKDEGKLCPQNFQIWVAFLMGMVVIVIAIVVFDNVSGKSRLGTDTKDKIAVDDSVRYQAIADSYTTPGQPVSYLRETESAPGAWLGIETSDITGAMAKELGLKISGGVLISRVIENSPAEKAGLLSGDIIYEFDRHDAANTDELASLLSKLDPGKRVRVALFRDGKRKVLYVELAEAAAAGSTSSVRQVAGEVTPSDLKWGIVVSEITESLREAYDIPGKENGVVVMMVTPGSAADRAGIIKGDVIRQVGETPIYDLAGFFEAIGSNDNSSLLLNICRQGAQFYINIVAVSPFLPVGGPSGSEDEDSTESDGYKGMPAEIPPRGKPDASSVQQTQGVPVAQEGIGMNRPLYVPGYDQTQSGEPEEKTRSLPGTATKTI